MGQAAAEVLECSEAWRKGGATAKPAGSILRLLAALDELPAAAMLNAAYAMEGQTPISPIQLLYQVHPAKYSEITQKPKKPNLLSVCFRRT